MPPDVTVIRVDVDPGELDQSVKPSITVEADAHEATLSVARGGRGRRSTHGQHAVAARTDATHDLGARLRDGLAARFPDLASCCEQLRAAIPDDGVLVDEMTQVGYYARNGYPVEGPGQYLGSGYQGTLGFGFPTGLGAKVGAGDRVVVSISGDGGFLYGAGELRDSRATRHRSRCGRVPRTTPTATCCACNKKHRPRDRSRLRNPDLVKLAESFGVAHTSPISETSEPPSARGRGGWPRSR